MAQSPANRTAKTTVADVLVQMPAAKQAEYNKLIKELSSTDVNRQNQSAGQR